MLALFTAILPILAAPVQESNVGAKKYIVGLKDNLDVESHIQWVSDIHARSLSRRDTAGVEKTLEIGTFHAYTGEFDQDTIAQVKENPNVAFVEEDEEQTRAIVTQNDAPWGIASLSVPSLPNGNTLGQKYTYDSTAGAGTFVYVFDTGVTTNNTEFEGRAIKGFTPWVEEEFIDFFGHGTHVAGIIGSKTFGVAKKATIYDVKVARGVGYATGGKVLEGIEWAVKNATGTPGRAAKSVINVSLALPFSQALNQGFAAAYASGVLSIVGAANDGKVASGKSPASEPTAITVGAVDWQKNAAEWSNFGPLVDIFAPGVDIPSLWNTEGRVATVSGTSMASPHVAGLAAYLQGKEDLNTPAKATQRILELARKGEIKTNRPNTANVLAYHGAGA
ncbi:peptidase S8/S53 domain-containing protein [Pyrenochaeta sp. MPI-SDFR-AT-0127]|nr:peptidase S8/S53 domain-containing protein [Pyrenochaeta sp. MPI-SDFR-AT-0127]